MQQKESQQLLQHECDSGFNNLAESEQDLSIRIGKANSNFGSLSSFVDDFKIQADEQISHSNTICTSNFEALGSDFDNVQNLIDQNLSSELRKDFPTGKTPAKRVRKKSEIVSAISS